MKILVLVFSITIFIILLMIPRHNFRFWRRGKGGSWYLYEAIDDGHRFWINFKLDPEEFIPPRFVLLTEEHYAEKTV